MTKCWNILLGIAVVFCFSVFQAEGAEPFWANHDDIVIVHYPSVVAKSEVAGAVAKTPEWKQFLSDSASKVKSQYKDAVAKSEISASADAWIREQARNLLNKDGLSAVQIIGKNLDHAKVFAMGLKVDLSRSAKDRISGTVSCILDVNLFDSKDLKSFGQKELAPKKVFDEKGVLAFEIKAKDQNVFVGQSKVGPSKLYVIVIGRDKEEVIAKAKDFSQASQLAKSITANTKTLKELYLNSSFFKKIVPDIEKYYIKGKKVKDNILPKTDAFSNSTLMTLMNGSPCTFIKNICEKMDSVTYAIEQKDAKTISLVTCFRTHSDEDAEQLNDLVRGSIAFLKIQTQQKAQNKSTDKADKEVKKTNEEKAVEVLKIVTFNQKGKDLTATLNMTNDTVKNLVIKCLKRAGEKTVKKPL